MRNRAPISRVLPVIKRELASRRGTLAAASLFTAAVVAVAVTPKLLGTRVFQAFDALGDAQPAWLWLAALLVVVMLVASAQAWRTVVQSVGGNVSRVDASARYAIGSTVNTFAPARLGDVVRIALFSRVLGREDGTWTTVGVYTTIGAARAFWVGVLVVIAIATSALPAWAALASAVFVAAAVAAALIARRRNGSSHLAHFFDAYRELGRNPRRAAPIVFWVGVATLARVGAAAAIASSLGIRHSLAAALLIVPALEGGSLLPLAPGALGVSSGAVVLALKSAGIGTTTALTVGIGFHAVEAAAAVVGGIVGTLVLAGEQRPMARHAATVLAGACAIVVVAGSLGVGFDIA
jgi:uncharacterized membrane protein YbhN (UPF0104 family)